MTMTVAEGYTLTVLASLAAVERILADPRPGAFTPATLFGAHFIETFADTRVHS